MNANELCVNRDSESTCTIFSFNDISNIRTKREKIKYIHEQLSTIYGYNSSYMCGFDTNKVKTINISYHTYTFNDKTLCMFTLFETAYDVIILPPFDAITINIGVI